MFPALAFVPTLPWERRFRLDLGGGRGTATDETRGRVCEVAGVGGEGFMNQQPGSTGSIIDWALLVNPVVEHFGDCCFAFVPVCGPVPCLCFAECLEVVPESIAAWFRDG